MKTFRGLSFRIPRLLLALLLAAAALLAFALGGPYPSSVLLALPIVGLGVVALGLRLPPWILLPFAPLLLFVPPPAFIRVFDVVPLGLGTLSFLLLAQDPRRSSWNLGLPGLLGIAVLTTPLLALPVLANGISWLMPYKILVMACLVFFGLRRVVPPHRSHLLLYSFPLAGALVALELLQRTNPLGGLLAARPAYRAFYTSLGLGSSNYIGAIFVLCIGASAILWMIERRALFQFLIALAILVQFQAFFSLQSRGSMVGLVIIAAFLVIGGGRIYGILVAGVAALVIGMGLGTPAGMSLMRRFLDPQESASWFVRMELWQQSWARFLAHPFTGIGLNQGQYVGDEAGIADAHNVVLQALMEQGIAGGIVVVLVIVGVLRMTRNAAPQGLDGLLLKRVRRGLMGVACGVLLHAMIEPTLNGTEMLMLFAWFLGWLALQDPRARGESLAGDEQVVAPEIEERHALAG